MNYPIFSLADLWFLLKSEGLNMGKGENFSTTFPITHYPPPNKNNRKAAQRKKLWQQFFHSATFQVNRPHHFHKVFQRIESGDRLRPLRHTADGRE